MQPQGKIENDQEEKTSEQEKKCYLQKLKFRIG